MKNFTALDFETANASRSSVCSIGLAKVKNGEIIDTYYSLVNPGEHFDSRNIAVHGIRPEDVRNAPSFADIFTEVIDFIGSDPIVAHFAQFDINVLRGTAQKHGLTLPDNLYFCSCMLSKTMLTLPSHKLNVVAGHFNFQFSHHNALEDAVACAVIVNHMIKPYPTLETMLDKLGYSFGSLTGLSFHKQKKELHPKKRPVAVSADQSHPFYNKALAFTGKLTGMTRQEAIELATKFGAEVHSAVNKNTDYLIVGESDAKKYRSGFVSANIQRAKSWQDKGSAVKLVSENKFFEVLLK